jgi:glycosyltransferase involved in cell wall biosynthesis
MKISVITVVLNGEKYLQTAIDSVIAQKYSSFEHIVVDGGSTDRTIEILKSNPHVRWISEPDHGPGDATKKGFSMATGDVLCLLPADDYLMPNAFNSVLSVFTQNVDCKWAAGRCIIVDHNGKEIRKFITWYKNLLLKHHSFFLLLTESYLSAQAVFFKKELLHQIGEYDLNAGTEYDLWVRFAEKHKLFFIDELLASFRMHYGSGTTSYTISPATKTFLTIKKRYFKTHPIAVSLHYLNCLKLIFCYSIINRAFKKQSKLPMAINTALFNKTWPEILRYVLGGATSAFLCWGSLVVFVEVLKINYMISANISGGITYLYSYLINKYLVFKKPENSHVKHGAKFILLQAALWVMSNAILFAGVDFLKIHYFIMVLLLSAFNAIINFVFMKFFVFKYYNI